jgi:hypothetical protein
MCGLLEAVGTVAGWYLLAIAGALILSAFLPGPKPSTKPYIGPFSELSPTARDRYYGKPFTAND